MCTTYEFIVKTDKIIYNSINIYYVSNSFKPSKSSKNLRKHHFFTHPSHHFCLPSYRDSSTQYLFRPISLFYRVLPPKTAAVTLFTERGKNMFRLKKNVMDWVYVLLIFLGETVVLGIQVFWEKESKLCFRKELVVF